MYNFHWMHRNGWENTRKGLIEMVTFLESKKIVSVLLPYGPTGTDFSLHFPDLLQATRKIRLMIALPAYGILPEYVLKTFITVQRWGRDRLDLNLVAGNYRGEVESKMIEDYPWDSDLVDTHTKRVELTEKWMEKFTKLIKEYKDEYPEPHFKTTLYVVGASDTTIRTANLYADYLIINDLMLNDETMSKLTNVKPLLVIDPLIVDSADKLNSVEYNEYTYTKNKKHPLKGTYEEVRAELIRMADQYNIKDFIIHTDQKDISQILKLIEDLSN